MGGALKRRQPFKEEPGGSTLLDVIEWIAEGNPGSLTALMSLASAFRDPLELNLILLAIEQAGYRGPQFYEAWNRCGRDVKVMLAALSNPELDKQLVNHVNREIPDYEPVARFSPIRRMAIRVMVERSEKGQP